MFSVPFQNWSEAWGRLGIGTAPASARISLEKAFAENPVLASIDKVWNANPLHDVIPIDWAGIAHALRVVWLRVDGQSRPGDGASGRVQRRGAALRGRGLDRRGPALAGPDSAPEGKPRGRRQALRGTRMAAQPGFRILSDLYLLASEALLRARPTRRAWTTAEEQRINFHLRQFVDAMSPSLMLFSNPVALRRVIETGGASIADGGATCSTT